MRTGPGSRASTRRRLVVATLLGASALVTAGVAVRVERTGSMDTTNLPWNLFLAWVPFVLAVVVYDRARRRAAIGPTVVAGLLWLLFLPNAPYIVSDYIWLDDWRRASVPLWYDASLYAVAALSGVVLGFVSLYLVQRVVARAAGEPLGWALAIASLLLGGVGLCLGRVLRWNSWDVFTRPGSLLADVGAGLVDPLAYPRALAIAVVAMTTLVAGYAALYGVIRGQLGKLDDVDRPRRHPR